MHASLLHVNWCATSQSYICTRLQVMLWNYPDRSCPPLRIDTMHDLNIFGVAFLPCTNSSHIVTSAFDRMVQLHRLDHTSMEPTAGRPRSDGEGAPPVAAQAVRCHTTTFLNHSESVKVRSHSSNLSAILHTRSQPPRVPPALASDLLCVPQSHQ